MSTTIETLDTPPELQPEPRRSNRLAIVLAILVGVLVLSLAGTVVGLVNSQGKYDTLSTKYDAQTSQVKDLTGQVKDLKNDVSDLEEQATLSRAAARASLLMSKALDKLLTGYSKDVFSRLLYITEAKTFVDQAFSIAKAYGYSDVNSLFRAAADSGTTV